MLTYRIQRRRQAPHKRRQQRSRRHGTLRPRPRLYRAERHYWKRSSIHSLRWLRYYPPERTSMVEDGDAGHNGHCGCFTKRIERVWGLQWRLGDTRHWHCMIEEKSMHKGASFVLWGYSGVLPNKSLLGLSTSQQMSTSPKLTILFIPFGPLTTVNLPDTTGWKLLVGIAGSWG
jgi:hypothetical protein